MRLRRSVAALTLLALASPAHAAVRNNFDAFLASTPSRSLRVDTNVLAAEGVQVAHREGRLGLPTFTWTDVSNFGAAAAVPEHAARAHLARLAPLYGMHAADIEQLVLRDVHDTGSGAIIASFGRSVGGVEVFRGEIDLVMNRDLALVAVSGYLPPSDMVEKARHERFGLRAEQAIARGFADATGAELASDLLLPAESEGAYRAFDLPAGVGELLGWDFTAPARAKPVFFLLADSLVPGWYVEIAAEERGGGDAPFLSYVVDARDGGLLFRNDLTAHATYRVFAEPWSMLPDDSPHGTSATPHPTGVPDGYRPPLGSPRDVSLQNYPFSRVDPWLAPNAVETRGNNVDAYADLVAPDGFQHGLDLRAPATGPGEFLHAYDPNLPPQHDTTQIAASVTQLFYVTNFLHDWFYDAGFDERAGNAQTTNFGRGGLGNDALLAEAQDYGGRNNANMRTPADGAAPRMQMYRYDGTPEVRVLTPPALARVESSEKGLGPTNVDVTGTLSIADPNGTTLGCSPFPQGFFAGRIALLDRGTCTYADKALHAQSAGAIAVLIANNVAGPPAALGGAAPGLTIPALPVSQATGAAWKAWAAGSPGAPIDLRLRAGAALDRDASLDNTVVAHEWGHMISNRLIGDANGLSTQAARALGEGWGDFHALLLTARQEDINSPANANWNGVYAIGGYVESGDPHYYGTRRVPYSTSFASNALTLRHIQEGVPLPTAHPISGSALNLANGIGNAQVHNAGEVWASMLWDSYVALLRAHPFSESQDRMKRYLVGAYKATPVMPTFLEARDALLAVAAAHDPADYQRFLSAFARRGAGVGAAVANRNSQDFVGVRESWSTGAYLEAAFELDDSLAGCDRDGVLDAGEVGALRITVTNTGRTTLPWQTVSLADDSGAATFPGGNTVAIGHLVPGQSTTVQAAVMLASPSGAANVTIDVTFDEPSLPAIVRYASYTAPVHHDVRLGVSATDEMDASMSAWTTADWSWRREGGSTFVHRDDVAVAGEGVLESPWIEVAPSGNFGVTLRHRYSFESSDGYAPWYDGGVLEYSLDGLTWNDVYLDLDINPGYAGYLAEGGDNPLDGRPAFVGMSAGFPGWTNRTLNFGTTLAGQTVKFRFRQGSDMFVGAYGWDIDSFSVTNAINTPFGAMVPEPWVVGSACNQLPVADVRSVSSAWEGGFDATGAFVRSVVTLDGTGSFDPEGAPLTYAWQQLAGSSVALSAPTAAVTTFSPDVARNERFTFALQVSDGIEQSQPRLIDILVANVNRPPVAVAAAPAIVQERGVSNFVTLDGSGASDPDGEALTYVWSQVSGPAVALGGTTAPAASFELPEVASDTTFGFELVVSDGIDVSAPALVEVTVQNVDRAPTVVAGADDVVASRGTYALVAVADDADGDVVTVTWTQIAGPAVVLAADGSFVAPSVTVDTTLEFQATAEAAGVSVSDTVVITVLAEPAPFADAGGDFDAAGRSIVVLRGAGNVPGGGVVSFAWTQLAGETVVLSGADTATASFVSPDVKTASTLVFQFTVAANGMASSDTVAVNVAADGAPTVSAGDDVVAASRAHVALYATASDPDGDAIVWSWVQTAGVPVELIGAATNAPSFVAPSVVAEETLVFEVNALANGLEARDEVRVVVAAEAVPTVSAGDDFAVAGRVPVLLRGAVAGATDVRWTQLEGPQVELVDATSAVATFVSPDVKAEAELVFELSAQAHGQQASDTVRVTVAPDRAPVAVAGANVDVAARSTMTLRGEVSDADGDALSFAWSQVSGPAVTLVGAGTLTPTFMAPDWREEAPAELVFSLVASANGLDSAPSLVTVRVHKENRVPVVRGPNEVAADERTPVELVAEGIDADGGTLQFSWVQTGGPAVEVDGADTSTLSFVTPEVAADMRLSFMLVVIDSDGASSEEVIVTVLVRNVNRGPVAVVSEVAEAAAGATVLLDGSRSSDPDGGALVYTWRQVEGENVMLSATDAAVATFVAPAAAQAQVLVFELTVTDAEGATATSRVSVDIAAASQPGPKRSADEGGCSTSGGSGGAGLLVVGAAALMAARRRRVR